MYWAAWTNHGGDVDQDEGEGHVKQTHVLFDLLLKIFQTPSWWVKKYSDVLCPLVELDYSSFQRRLISDKQFPDGETSKSSFLDPVLPICLGLVNVFWLNPAEKLANIDNTMAISTQ